MSLSPGLDKLLEYFKAGLDFFPGAMFFHKSQCMTKYPVIIFQVSQIHCISFFGGIIQLFPSAFTCLFFAYQSFIFYLFIIWEIAALDLLKSWESSVTVLPG